LDALTTMKLGAFPRFSQAIAGLWTCSWQAVFSIYAQA